MANYCSNIVEFREFRADRDTLAKLRMMFLQLALAETSTGLGQLPDNYVRDHGFMFNIRWDLDMLYYETKWEPNIQVLIFIADHHKADFICNYEESAMSVYGEAEYRNGILRNVHLNEDDFNQYRLDE